MIRTTFALSKKEDLTFFEELFKYVFFMEKQTNKKAFTYYGGAIFEEAFNGPNVLAETMLENMVNFHTVPTFIDKMILVTKLNNTS